MIILKVTVIYGNPDENNTYEYTHFLLKNLRNHMKINLTEYFLPEDFYLSCKNYCKYFISYCDYFNSCNINKIAKSISDSDMIILACSSIKMHLLPPSLKLLLDHLSYLWMPHKNNIPMSKKIGLVLSDDYVPILPSASKILRKYLKFWGIKNILNCNIHNKSKSLVEKDALSKDYLSIILLSVKIINMISSDPSFSCLNSKKIIKFPYSKLINQKNICQNKHSINKVISIKKIQNNL